MQRESLSSIFDWTQSLDQDGEVAHGTSSSCQDHPNVMCNEAQGPSPSLHGLKRPESCIQSEQALTIPRTTQQDFSFVALSDLDTRPTSVIAPGAIVWTGQTPPSATTSMMQARISPIHNEWLMAPGVSAIYSETSRALPMSGSPGVPIYSPASTQDSWGASSSVPSPYYGFVHHDTQAPPGADRADSANTVLLPSYFRLERSGVRKTPYRVVALDASAAQTSLSDFATQNKVGQHLKDLARASAPPDKHLLTQVWNCVKGETSAVMYLGNDGLWHGEITQTSGRYLYANGKNPQFVGDETAPSYPVTEVKVTASRSNNKQPWQHKVNPWSGDTSLWIRTMGTKELEHSFADWGTAEGPDERKLVGHNAVYDGERSYQVVGSEWEVQGVRKPGCQRSRRPGAGRKKASQSPNTSSLTRSVTDC